jgi:ABC-type amino acid transport substrate-binding protein
MGSSRRGFSMATVMLTVALLSGCGMPMDPDGTLESVRGQVLTVGATAARDRVSLSADGEPAGVEPDLVRAFADTIDADVVFVEGSEAELVDLLERDAIDVAIGGFLDDTPWVDKAGTTLPYAETQSPTRTTERHVLLVPLGENALLLALDRFLTDQENAA